MLTTDILKLRILILLLEKETTKCSVTLIARTLQVEKYTVSRMMTRMEEEGLVDKKDIRAPKLTEAGRKEAQRYRERVDIALNHFMFEGVSLENAKEDALIVAVYCSDETINIMRNRDEKYRIRNILKDRKVFDGGILCKNMRDGNYQLPFIIYREMGQKQNIVSMANNGFEHPCTLAVKNGRGMIQLRIAEVSEKAVNGKIMQGKVKKFDYYDTSEYISAEFYGDMVTFPARVIQFTNVGDNLEHHIHGNVVIRVQSSVGLMNMPESTAYFTIMV